MELFVDVFFDAAKDCLRMLPFLFLAFFLLELLEHRLAGRLQGFLARAGNFGPLVGSVLGVVPQCGFSIMASDFFAGGVISMGTLLAVYLSTSDEALVLLLSEPGHTGDILSLVLSKVAIGTLGGYLVLLMERLGLLGKRRKETTALCGEANKAGIGTPGMRHIVWLAINHTKEVFLYLFLFTFFIGLAMEGFGMEAIRKVFLKGSLFQPLLASVIGLIPNCASSIMLTRLYLEGFLSFGAAVAGLCSSAGLGLLVLFRVNKNPGQNARVLGLLIGISFVSGELLQLL